MSLDVALVDGSQRPVASAASAVSSGGRGAQFAALVRQVQGSLAAGTGAAGVLGLGAAPAPREAEPVEAPREIVREPERDDAAPGVDARDEPREVEDEDRPTEATTSEPAAPIAAVPIAPQAQPLMAAATTVIPNSAGADVAPVQSAAPNAGQAGPVPVDGQGDTGQPTRANPLQTANAAPDAAPASEPDAELQTGQAAELARRLPAGSRLAVKVIEETPATDATRLGLTPARDQATGSASTAQEGAAPQAAVQKAAAATTEFNGQQGGQFHDQPGQQSGQGKPGQSLANGGNGTGQAQPQGTQPQQQPSAATPPAPAVATAAAPVQAAAPAQNSAPPPGATTATPPVAGAGEVKPGSFQAQLARPAAPQAPAQPERPHPVTEQVTVRIAQAAADGKDRISVQLRPAELGRVEVKLEVQDGRVTAQVVADSREALDVLKADAKGLEKALQEAGLKTDPGGLEFSLRGGEGDPRTARDGTRNRGGAYGREATAPDPLGAAEPDLAALRAQASAARGGVDISV